MNTTALLLERLGSLIHQSVRDEAARHGLQPIHLQILSYLARANRYSDIPIAVAEYLGITRGTVSQSLAVLERKGLLRKAADPQHGKRVHLQLTPAAHQLLHEAWPERLQIALADEGPSSQTLEETLRHVLATLQQQNQQRPFGICRQCRHFLTERTGARCGLTGETLANEQTTRICREWTSSTPHD